MQMYMKPRRTNGGDEAGKTVFCRGAARGGQEPLEEERSPVMAAAIERVEGGRQKPSPRRRDGVSLRRAT